MQVQKIQQNSYNTSFGTRFSNAFVARMKHEIAKGTVTADGKETLKNLSADGLPVTLHIKKVEVPSPPYEGYTREAICIIPDNEFENLAILAEKKLDPNLIDSEYCKAYDRISPLKIYPDTKNKDISVSSKKYIGDHRNPVHSMIYAMYKQNYHDVPCSVDTISTQLPVDESHMISYHPFFTQLNNRSFAEQFKNVYNQTKKDFNTIINKHDELKQPTVETCSLDNILNSL